MGEIRLGDGDLVPRVSEARLPPGVGQFVGARNSLVATAKTALQGLKPLSVVVVGEMGSGKTTFLRGLSMELTDTFLIQVRGSAVTGRSEYGSLGLLMSDLPDEALEHPTLAVDGLDQVLRQRADGRRVVFMVDNAHLLDAHSAMVLDQLARRGTLAVVATVPDVGALPDDLQHLAIGTWSVRIDLAPFTLAETTEVLSGDLGGVVSREAAYWLWEASAGNPLYLRMVSMGHLSDGRLEQRNGAWLITAPESVTGSASAYALARLRAMPEGHRRLLTVLAHLEAASLPLLSELVPGSVIDEAFDQRMLQVDRRSEPLVRLRHRLLGDVVRSETPVLAGRCLREEVLVALAKTGGTAPAATRLGLTEWSLALGENIPAEQLYQSIETALQRMEHDRARRIADHLPAAGDLRHTVACVSVLVAVGDYQAAATMLDATAFTPEDGREDFVNLKLIEQEVRRHGDRCEDRVAEAIAAAGAAAAGDRRLRSLVESAEFDRAAHQGQYAQIIDAAHDDAGFVVGADGDRLSDAQAVRISWLAEALCQVGETDRAVELIEGLFTRLDRRTVSAQSWGLITTRMYFVYLFAGRVHRCRRFLQELDRAVEDGELSPGFHSLSSHDTRSGVLFALMGRGDDALTCLRPAVAQLRLHDPESLISLALAAAAMATATCGDKEEARRYLVEWKVSPAHPWFLVQRLGQLLARWAEFLVGEDATRIAEDLAATSSEDESAGRVQLALVFGLGAVFAGSVQARAAVDRLGAGLHGRLPRLALRVNAALATSRPEDLLAAAEHATTAGLDAVLMLLTEAMLRGKACELDANQRRSARRVLQGSTLRMTSPATALQKMEGLSGTERRVARGVATGLTTREVGQQLFLSARTVEWHLARIFDKLDVSGREGLGTLVRLSSRP
ncbi:LuxR C-terminal-related transcriptional regulator [Tersicoccus phoenicis]|nr:LuxR C-terminal-related transcriptional regulator [Tersicoccus phoenicis]